MRLSDIYYYVEGNIRWMMFRRCRRMIRGHIMEQIVSRVRSADAECTCMGRCKICGCHTPALYMCGKSCDKPCYPRMMSRRRWERFKEEGGDKEWIYYGGKFHKINKVYE